MKEAWQTRKQFHTIWPNLSGTRRHGRLRRYTVRHVSFEAVSIASLEFCPSRKPYGDSLLPIRNQAPEGIGVRSINREIPQCVDKLEGFVLRIQVNCFKSNQTCLRVKLFFRMVGTTGDGRFSPFQILRIITPRRQRMFDRIV